ncbi:MAG: hypothetical protein HYV45_02470 [Candidatus Moranbacteria bacterium]|nr:hypothetical protein [Candidatus Moranbacteria bacterium]
MKVFFLRFLFIVTILFFEYSFLDILFPIITVPVLLLSTVVAWTLVAGFPRAIIFLLPLTIIFDCVSLGTISALTLYAVLLSYATGFFSRRLLAERRGLSMAIYAFFSAINVLGFMLFVKIFFQKNDISFFLLSEIATAVFSWQFFLSFFLSFFLFFPAYYSIRMFEEYIKNIVQSEFSRIR